MFEPHFPGFDKQDGFDPEKELSELLDGPFMAPPAFNVTAGQNPPSEDPPADQGDRDQFITDTARREMETTADFARFLPMEDLQQINQISHPVKDAYLNPLENSNLSRQNLELMYQEWLEQDPDADPRKFAYMLTTAYSETYHTMQGVNESIDPTQWAKDNVSAYADTGYWGRGFVQLTWQSGYQKLGEELGLDLKEFPQMAVLPSISSDIMGTGMFQSGYGGDNTLSQFFNGSQADWTGARSIIGVNDGEGIGARGEAIYQDMLSYEQAKADGDIPADMSLTDYLYAHGETNLFGEARNADAIRILHALGYYAYERPGFGEPNEAQSQYMTDSDSSGYAYEMLQLDTPAEKAALIAFQKDYNAAHNLETPLNEQGVLDEATMRALNAGGHQIASGNEMINYAFNGELTPTDLFAESLSRFQKGESGIQTLGGELLSYMPAPDPQVVLNIFAELSDRDARRLAHAMASQALDHDALAGMNTEILIHLRNTLQGEQFGDKLAEAVSTILPSADDHLEANAEQADRIDAVLSHEGGPRPKYHIVEAGGTWWGIQQQYAQWDVTQEELLELNGLDGSSPLQIGQSLLLPKRTWGPLEEV